MNRNILYNDVMNIYLIVIEGKHGANDAGDYSYHGYYIINFFHFRLTFKKA